MRINMSAGSELAAEHLRGERLAGGRKDERQSATGAATEQERKLLQVAADAREHLPVGHEERRWEQNLCRSWVQELDRRPQPSLWRGSGPEPF